MSQRLDNYTGRSKARRKSAAWVTDKQNADGILSLSYCWMFQAGVTKIRKISTDSLTQLPSNFDRHVRYAQLVGEKIRIAGLPPGFSVYQDLVFELETEAVFSGSTVTLRLPSVKTESEFKKLVVIYLDEGRTVPGFMVWKTVSETRGKQISDYASRTISSDFELGSVFHHGTGTARIVVASFDQEEADRSAVDLSIRSVTGPPTVKLGEKFSYNVSVVNSGATGRPATEVALLVVISSGRFISATGTQGGCRQSVNSDPEIVCELGTIDSGKTVTMTINIKSDTQGSYPDRTEVVFLTLNNVISREKDYSPENNYYESRGTIIDR